MSWWPEFTSQALYYTKQNYQRSNFTLLYWCKEMQKSYIFYGHFSDPYWKVTIAHGSIWFLLKARGFSTQDDDGENGRCVFSTAKCSWFWRCLTGALFSQTWASHELLRYTDCSSLVSRKQEAADKVSLQRWNERETGWKVQSMMDGPFPLKVTTRENQPLKMY